MEWNCFYTRATKDCFSLYRSGISVFRDGLSPLYHPTDFPQSIRPMCRNSTYVSEGAIVVSPFSRVQNVFAPSANAIRSACSLALEYALTQLWRSWGIEPNAVLGHSLGEYIAACVAGVFSLEDGLKLVAERGKLMQSLDRKGKMAIVFADEHRVCHAIAPYQEQITLAALNGPKTTVISGTEESVQAVLLDLESKGVVAQFMESTHAFHSPLMEPILGAFVQVANQVRFLPPRRPLISNVTGKQVQAGVIPDAAYWRQQLREPVRFAEGIHTLGELGCQIFIELGPQPHLLTMGKRCFPKGIGTWLPSLTKGQDDWQCLLQSLSALYVQGVSIDWATRLTFPQTRS